MRIKILLMVSIILFLVYGCCSTSTERIVKKMSSNPIVLSLSEMEERNSVDTSINLNREIDRPNIIVYYDSLGCKSCKVEGLEKWRDYVSMSKNKINLYFIFHSGSRKLKELDRLIHLNYKGYPVFIDSLGIFERDNPHLPKESIFHTFLTDERNYVQIVGNPIMNESIDLLYRKYLDEME